jgi:K+-sensing histidine kinase KdpD
MGPPGSWSGTRVQASTGARGPRVFERFYTGDSVSGSGLGLAIARELATRMNGDLEVSSRRGRTEFTLELPAETRVRAVSARLSKGGGGRGS